MHFLLSTSEEFGLCSLLTLRLRIVSGARMTLNDLAYGAKVSRLPPELAERFIQLDRDEETNTFLNSCLRRSKTSRYISAKLAQLLRVVLSRTSANGVLGRGSMFVMSSAQLSKLLGKDGVQATEGVLLDVGAGDGKVTEKFLPMFSDVVTTERSMPMVRRMKQSGNYAAVVYAEDVSECARLATEAGVELPSGGTRFDAVALLNVLDRCDKPLSLMRQLHGLVEGGSGRVIIAVVLPFRPFVEHGAERRSPIERLNMDPNASWEQSVKDLTDKLFLPTGFQVESISRVPYLAEGDLYSPVYGLDDAIFVLSVPKVISEDA
ncbi:hypothetical protein CYMTET_50401 [Cymbomonas tetramitiformis]|uniref:Methyltransferase-like protein 9 n=1 Tax=Cymbomonas tetramitiformis TaxID=36881 RepID=A0AAE0BNA2_9CHLO|nr:hypothetical protein CYMTET_50401 [Cymbomonas tetramitiformis]